MVQRFGPYEVVGRIGRGGMADVFIALRRGLGRFEKVVAVKQLLPELVDEPDLVQRFLEEARVVAGLDHPNVCQVFDVGQEGDDYYIIMEYLAGQSLARVWKRG